MRMGAVHQWRLAVAHVKVGEDVPIGGESEAHVAGDPGGQVEELDQEVSGGGSGVELPLGPQMRGRLRVDVGRLDVRLHRVADEWRRAQQVGYGLGPERDALLGAVLGPTVAAVLVEAGAGAAGLLEGLHDEGTRRDEDGHHADERGVAQRGDVP